MFNHVQPWSPMFNHGPTSHCEKDCLNIKINHGQPWSNVKLREILSQYENKSWSTMVNSLGPMPHSNNHGQHRIATEIVSIWKSTIVNHGLTSYCGNDCLEWKLIMVNHVYFEVCNIYLRVYIIPLGLILFLFVYSIIPFGL